VVKKVAAKSFADVRRSGIIAINLKGGDKLVSAHLAARATPFPRDREGPVHPLREGDVREMGRTAGGVRGMSVKKGDEVVSAEVIPAQDAKNARSSSS
jgi:DNA gyrase subunit A